MLRKFLAAHLGLLVLLLAVFGVLSAHSTRRRILGEISARLRSEAEMLRPVVRSSSDLQKTVRELGARVESRLTVIAGDGMVLADSHAEPARLENYNGRPEVRQARARGSGQSVRYSEAVEYDMMYYAVLADPGDPGGIVVRSALPLTLLREEMNSLYAELAIAFLATGAAGVVLSFLVARIATRPLREIRAVARAIAAGDLTQRAPLASPDEIGSVALAINRMAEELTARLNSLKAESSKLETLIASMQEGVIAVDGDGTVLHCNGAALELFGLVRDPVGLKVWEVVRIAEVEQAVRRVLAESVPVRVRCAVKGRTIAVGIRPVRGRPGAVVVAEDVTEQQRYDDLRREFVANVSHELRTPLTLIRGYVETLKTGGLEDRPHATEFLEIIDKNVRRLCAIVEDLLELSRLEAGVQILKARETRILPLLDKIREIYQPLADKKKQKLAVEGEDGRLVADPDLLERALSNLVDNAVKYTPEGGSIRIRVSQRPDQVEFSVQDTGIGIPDKDLPRIFERFYRVDKSRSRELGGTGLGLAIVKHIAQLHGGGVTAQSTPGCGSVFTLWVPRDAPSARG